MGDGLVTVSGLADGSCVTMVIVSAGIVVISKVVVRSSRVVPAAVVDSVGSAVVLSVPWVVESPTVV